ncbi:MAG: cytochrome c oxidase subunit 3, partial [Pseudomonadota bacterium]
KFRAGWNPDILENPEAFASWPPPSIETVDPWHLPLINTLILLLSGTTVTWGHHALIHGDRKGAKWGIGLTVALGVLFTAVQAVEYIHLFDYRAVDGLKGTFWLSTNVYGSAFFMATGFHGLHVLIGTIFLFVIWGRLMKGGMSSEKHFGLEAAAWYWHFVDVVWLFLFAFVYVAFG